MSIKPITRKEIFEEAIAKGKVPTIKPLTRQEMIMAKEAKRESESSGGGGNFIVTIPHSTDEDSYTSDKTVDEILTAINSGQNVVLHVSRSSNGDVFEVYPLTSYREDPIMGKNVDFSRVYYSGSVLLEYSFSISSGGVYFTEYEIPVTAN